MRRSVLFVAILALSTAACVFGNAPNGDVVRACWKGVVGDGATTPFTALSGRSRTCIAITGPTN